MQCSGSLGEAHPAALLPIAPPSWSLATWDILVHRQTSATFAQADLQWVSLGDLLSLAGYVTLTPFPPSPALGFKLPPFEARSCPHAPFLLRAH